MHHAPHFARKVAGAPLLDKDARQALRAQHVFWADVRRLLQKLDADVQVVQLGSAFVDGRQAQARSDDLVFHHLVIQQRKSRQPGRGGRRGGLGLGQRLFQRLAHLPLPNVALRLEAHARIQGQALLLHAGGHVDGIGQALSHGGHQLRQPADQLRDKLFSRLAGQTHLRGICRRRCHVRSWASPGGPEEAGLHHGASVRVVGIVLFAGLDQVFALDAQPHGDGRRHEYR